VYARYAHTDVGEAYFDRIPGDSFIGKSGAPNFILNFVKSYPQLDAEKEEFDLAYVNVWCPYHCPVEQKPLAVLDAQTLEKEDVVATTYTGIEELNNRLQYAGDRRDNKVSLCLVYSKMHC
jgi:hypothetical protein